jgi:hypothetical protein
VHGCCPHGVSAFPGVDGTVAGMARRKPTARHRPDDPTAGYLIREWSLMGWCMSANHGGCPARYISWQTEGNTVPTRCSCTCHRWDDDGNLLPAVEAAPTTPAATARTPKRRPRPPKQS